MIWSVGISFVIVASCGSVYAVYLLHIFSGGSSGVTRSFLHDIRIIDNIHWTVVIIATPVRTAWS